MTFITRALCLLAALLPIAAALADGEGPHTFTFYLENDGGIVKRNNPNDEHYTNGIAGSFSWQPEWVQGVTTWPGLGESFTDAGFGVIVGHQIFTPYDTLNEELVRNDRSYAGYLFAGAFVERRNHNTLDHLQLDLGLVGPSAGGEDAQNTVHEWFGTDKIKGWDHQLHDEPTIQLFLRRKWNLLADPDDPTADDCFQVIPQAKLALGTVYRHVEAGVLVRAGLNLPDDFGPGRLADPTVTWSQQTQPLSVYGFVRLAGRVVEHNMFIEGNNFESSHGRGATPLVGEAQLGVVLRWQFRPACALEAGYSETFLTKQFDREHGGDEYAAFTFAVHCGF